MNIKEKGRIKYFNEHQGIGIIISENGEELFFHFSSIVSDDDFKSIKIDELVEFSREKDYPEIALNVKKIEISGSHYKCSLLLPTFDNSFDDKECQNETLTIYHNIDQTILGPLENLKKISFEVRRTYNEFYQGWKFQFRDMDFIEKRYSIPEFNIKIIRNLVGKKINGPFKKFHNNIFLYCLTMNQVKRKNDIEKRRNAERLSEDFNGYSGMSHDGVEWMGADDLVRIEGSDEWRPASQKELNSLVEIQVSEQLKFDNFLNNNPDYQALCNHLDQFFSKKDIDAINDFIFTENYPQLIGNYIDGNREGQWVYYSSKIIKSSKNKSECDFFIKMNYKKNIIVNAKAYFHQYDNYEEILIDHNFDIDRINFLDAPDDLNLWWKTRSYRFDNRRTLINDIKAVLNEKIN